MDFADSVTISLIGLTVVFAVLIILSLLIKLQSMLLGFFEERQSKSDLERKLTAAFEAELTEAADTGWTAGELKLIDVDEKTAAMIMAIISDESQIPLSQLQFKMIKALD